MGNGNRYSNIAATEREREREREQERKVRFNEKNRPFIDKSTMQMSIF